MVYSVVKNLKHNYGLDISDEIDHEYVESIGSVEDVKEYLAEVGSECYSDNAYTPFRFSIRYDIFKDGEWEGEYWHDNEYWG